MVSWTYLRQVGEQTSEALEIYQQPSLPHYMVSMPVNTSISNKCDQFTASTVDLVCCLGTMVTNCPFAMIIALFLYFSTAFLSISDTPLHPHRCSNNLQHFPTA